MLPSAPAARWRLLGLTLLCGVAFYLLEALGQATATASEFSVLWPATGFAVAVAVLFTPFAPLAVFAADTVFEGVVVGLPWHVGATIALGNALQVALAAHLLRRMGGRDALVTVEGVMRFLLVAIVATIPGATLGVGAFVAGGIIAPADAATSALLWWASDIVSILLVAVPFLVWSREGARSARLERAGLAALAVVLALSLWAAYDEAFLVLAAFTLLLVTWASIRMRPRAGALVLLAAVAGLVAHSLSDAKADVVRLVSAQVFLAATALTGLMVGVVVQLQRQLSQRTEALAQVNDELEAFTYSVSHDLRAPLRAIEGFGALLQDDLPPEGRAAEDVARMRAATRRAQGLIDDLLGLSRVGRAPMRRVPVDLSALAREVLAELHKADAGRQVVATIQPGLVAAGDPSLLRILLENLLDNAWKFTSRKESARIEVGGVPSEDGLVCHVRDDGAGFDPAFSSRLFTPFQRLHRAEDFPGTGVGLATVRRIVVRHGGRVWATSEPGKGATFAFVLPSAPRDLAPAARGSPSPTLAPAAADAQPTHGPG